MISSSLSLRYDVSSSSLSSCSTPPRCHSLADLAEGVEVKGGRKSLPASSSTGQPEGSGRQSLVPLESREHDWLVKGASGAWPDIYSLFRDDPSLLNRRDFISGFTVLHWIAKHGDHRVLNTLWYGVQKAGVSFDINARSTCGHTPLHIATIHGHKNIMRLLVSKFNADVKLRDTAGKKPWQYLSRTSPPDIFQLLGAPARAALGEGAGGVEGVESKWKQERQQQQQQRRRRRHHLSSASSGERPMSITAKVKRSSSIAAFLKHKSFRHFHGHQSDSSV
uniref:ankyrin repeat domain-containing protein SOWAHB-like n=1 Tax=Semicossyphus pulcher TaxID=241346 RepID=UPI0037E8960F